MRQARMLPCLLALCLLSTAAVTAQADRQDILDYSLTLPRANSLIAAMQAMTAYMASRPDVATVMARSAKMTRPQLIAQMESDPKAMSIVKEHGLSAHDYVYGVPALRMALMAAQGVAGPNVIASPANVAFAKANLAQLKPKMDAADGIKR